MPPECWGLAVGTFMMDIDPAAYLAELAWATELSDLVSGLAKAVMFGDRGRDCVPLWIGGSRGSRCGRSRCNPDHRVEHRHAHLGRPVVHHRLLCHQGRLIWVSG